MASKYAFPKALKELRFHLCQTGEASTPLRSFLTKAYPVMKKHNPYTPILIREAAGVPPQLIARYEFGKEVKLPLDGVSAAQLEKTVQSFVLTPQ
ncbi:NI8M subunit of mitochondrial NADH:ubiquinone oxidoreductase [Myxozyma melibiosi]|uniref:NI8M subunit of mitochondrial NADH:ubiquinone oxidoreductase n=1 Tax=Myxozyma melibiosi TaxID=54550 RepID=A0ABR1FER2_9ASCO